MRKTKRIGVIYDPLNISTALLVRGGSLTQVHCAETAEYIPDREITPLCIIPQVWVNDPNGIITNGAVSLSEVQWYALPQDIAAQVNDESYFSGELTQYLITVASQGYTIGTDGSLTVAANTPYLSPVVLVFTGNYIDRRNGNILRIHATAVLSTTSIALPAVLSLDKPASWVFNPIEDTGLRSIVATLRLGGEVPDTDNCSVGYWWYIVSNGVETLIAADEDLFYESGQNTDTLVIDPRYIDSSAHIVCKVEYALTGESLPATPSSSCLTAETVVVRRYPDYDFENFVHGGVDVPVSALTVKNECVVTVGRKVLSSPSQWFSVKWSIRRAVYGAEWITLGYGDSIDVPVQEFADGADIGLEIDEFEPLGAMSDGDNTICDDEGNIITL